MKKLLIFGLLLIFFHSNAKATEYTWTWTGASSNQFEVAANWSVSPAPDANTAAMVFPRNLLGHTSIAVFNTSTSNIEMPSTYGTQFFINEIRVLSGTVSFIKTTLGNIEIGFDGAGLNISAGARLNVICDAQGIKLLMNATANNCTIAGTLDLTGTGSSSAPPKLEKPNFVNPVWTVVSGGKIILSGLNANILSTTPTSLKFLSGSSLDITRNGGTIPPADYQTGSTINVLGCTSTATSFSNSYDNFNGDIVWNCPNQTATTFAAQWSLSSVFITNFRGTFFMKAGYLRMIGAGLATETFGALNIQGGTFELGNTSGTTTPTVLGDVNVTGGSLRVCSSDFSGNVALTVNGNVVQSGGNINLAPGVQIGTLNVLRNVIQTGGTMTESGTSLTSALVFKGTSIQDATFLGTVSGDKFIVIINNGKKHVNLLSNVVLPYRLQCTAGDMIIGDKNLTVTEKVLGARTSGGVVTNGTGTLTLKAVDNVGKDFPVKTSSASHDAVYITSASGTSDYSVRVSPTINPVINLNLANTLPRQWEITSTSAGANLEFDPDPSAGAAVAAGSRSIGRLSSPPSIPWWVSLPAVDGLNQGYPFAADFTAFTSFVVGTTSVIPVEITAFKATNRTTNNLLNWTTATEINVAHFDIEKSADGVNNWSKIGESKAAGNSVKVNNYSFVDENPFIVSYYRLKTLDLDGKVTISKTVSVQQNIGKGTFKVFPQPVVDVATIQLESATNATAIIQVIDASGRLVLSKNAQITEGVNGVTISTQNLASGLYFMQINNGTSTMTEKFVKY